jgi:Holliday junction resolvase RusA-like endonuclease
MTTTLTINVIGTPAPQGSKSAYVVNGRAVMTESSKKVKPWRQDVKQAARDALPDIGWNAYTGPVELAITFYMPRPKAHYRTGRHAHELRPDAPSYVDKMPDLSKLVRSTEDALSEARVWGDDRQVARLTVEKRYADAATGARITITPLTAVAPEGLGEDPDGATAPNTQKETLF